MGLSLQDRVARLPEHERKAWLAAQPDYLIDEILRGEWWWVARPEQIPPPGDWFVCLALAGRGFGKSRSGSEWIVERVVNHPYDSSGTPTEWLVIAETLSDARTICMEGPAGILRVLERRKIEHRYKMSPRPMVLFPNGSKIYTEGADDPDVGRGYNASGAWLDEICIAKNEPVITARGSVPVQEVTTADRVLTRGGWRRVKWAGLTKQTAEVLRITTTVGTVVVTPNHRVWVNGYWVTASEVRPYDVMEACHVQSKLMDQLPVKLQHSMNGTERRGISTSEWDTTSIEPGHYCTVAFGARSTVPSLMGTRSTTSTGSAGITGSKTWKRSLCTNTAPYLLNNVMTELHGWQTPHQRLRLNGSSPTGNGESRARSSAYSAVRNISAPGCELSSALQTAVRQPDAPRIRPVVISVERVPDTDVYDITVDDEEFPEFFAGSGNLLVHNCKWKHPKAAWIEGIMPSLRSDLVGDHPRAFITTTPKPIDIIKDWVSRNDGTVHVIRGSTFDNFGNLSPMVIQELKRRYDGTAIGLQELYGEIIEAFEGALFNRLDMENTRVDDVPDDIVSTVVGVDPSLTGEDDEMGIVVASRDREKHMFIRADRSIMAVGRAAALEAWRVVAEYGADRLVVEENLGKRWMQQVFNDAYYELVKGGLFPEHTKPPLVRVDAKLGKRTRGEPVAMRMEQGRLHLVGRFKELEDQMATFTGWGTKESPDRLDALVHACRYLMDGEKKEARISSPIDVLSTTLQELLGNEGSFYHFG